MFRVSKGDWFFVQKGNIIEIDTMQGGGAWKNGQGCHVVVCGY